MKKLTLFALTAAAASLCMAPAAKAQVNVYDNTENFEGVTAINGGVTGASGNRYTYLVADDLTYSTLAAGLPVTQFTFSVGNSNTTSQAIKPEVRFWASDGVNGGPGTLLAAYNFGTQTIPAATVEGLNYAPTAGTTFDLPSSGTIWAGITYENSGSSETAAVINNFGQGLFDPPTVGSSTDEAFFSSATGTFAASNPAGSIVASPYVQYIANLEWQVQVLTLPAVPEPSAYAFAGIGALSLGGVLLRRNRRKAAL